jgi:hypothetical protein
LIKLLFPLPVTPTTPMNTGLSSAALLEELDRIRLTGWDSFWFADRKGFNGCFWEFSSGERRIELSFLRGGIGGGVFFGGPIVFNGCLDLSFCCEAKGFCAIVDFLTFKFLDGRENLGESGGCNLSMGASQYSYLLFRLKVLSAEDETMVQTSCHCKWTLSRGFSA